MRLASTVAAGVLACSIALGSATPALADAGGTARTALVLGGAAAYFVSNYEAKVREKKQDRRQQTSRRQAYQQWFYEHNGYYPSEAQIRSWYHRRYGSYPS